MSQYPATKNIYFALMALGFALLAFRWTQNGEEAGFLLILMLICSALLRWRFTALKRGVIADCLICAVFYPSALFLAVFSGFYYRVCFVGLTLIIIIADLPQAAIAALCGLCGLFLGLWEKEKERGLNRRDEETERYYELEALQNELFAAGTQIERMSVVSERARIAREIHDNAGHEIVAAFISLQTARDGFDETACDATALRLYDSALERLDAGMDKIREAVHNMAPVTALGVDALSSICKKYPADLEFNVFGDTNRVPVHVWNVLESCLNETLTNAAKHSSAALVTVSLDTTPNIIRLCVENENISPASSKNYGRGLRNLRHRAAAAGGSLSVDSGGEKFRVICVIPITPRKGEF